jgi:preprotein translocase subunit SecF
MFALSALVIAAGIAGTVSRGGFNLGIDFQAGLNQRVQIAPIGLELSYTGAGNARFDISDGRASLETRGEEGVEKIEAELSDFADMTSFAAFLSGVEGLDASAVLNSARPDSITTGLAFPLELGEEPASVNVRADSGSPVIIDQVRQALTGFDNPQVQVVGDSADQEFLLRVADPSGDKKDAYERQIIDNLESAFGAGTTVVKQSDYVGPRFSRDLAQQSISLTLMALLLILLYIWVRFKLGFAISSIAALVHDVVIMLGFIGVMRLEVSTTTIAAVLTIVGYSLNDTIVVFDRVRENMGLMKDRDIKDIIDTSISQSLSRTLMTSLTTLLAVLALYFFGTGVIKDFALNLVVGIVVGTYSSIFIASPVLLALTRMNEKRIAKKDPLRHNVHKAETVKEAPVAQKPAEAETPKEAKEVPAADRKLKGKRKGKRRK